EVRNRDLDAFAGRVAHDLRGPLNTVRLAGEQGFASGPGASVAPSGEAWNIFKRGIRRMEQLIDDLLMLPRIDAEMPGLVTEVAAVASFIEADLAPKVKEVSGTLQMQVQPAKVRCGEGLLRDVLWNLGENAVKYRRPDVPLRVDLVGHVSHDQYELSVSDN